MDPNATLKELRELVSRPDELDGTDTQRMCELVDALDGWLSSGGFLPKAWQADRPA